MGAVLPVALSALADGVGFVLLLALLVVIGAASDRRRRASAARRDVERRARRRSVPCDLDADAPDWLFPSRHKETS